MGGKRRGYEIKSGENGDSDMSDEKGKTRRNLMVFSTGVLAVTMLNIPLESSTFLGLNLKDVSPNRIWLCSLIVLIYLLLRYWHDPTIQLESRKWDEECRQSMRTHLMKRVRTDLGRNALGKRHAVKFIYPVPPAPGARPFILGDFYMDPSEWRTARAEMAWEHESLSDPGRYTRTRVPKSPAEARIPIRVLMTCWAKVRLRNLAPNWNMLELAVPLAMGAVAAIFCLIRLLS